MREGGTAPLREVGSPVADLVGPMPYRTMQSLLDGAFPSGRRNYWKSASCEISMTRPSPS